MARITRNLETIPEAELGGRTVLTPAEGGLRGDGPVDLVCGGCDTVLAHGVPDEALEGFRAALVEQVLRRGGARVSREEREIALRCRSCGAYNRLG